MPERRKNKEILMEYLYIVIILLISVVFIFLFIYQNRSLQKQIIALRQDNDKLKQENERLRAEELKQVRDIADLSAQIKLKEEIVENQKTDLLEMRERLNKDFQVLANQILEEKTNKFTDLNRLNMETILKPLGEKLAEFKTKVEETYDKESKQRFSLEEKIKDLVAINNQISEDANNLTRALKGSSKVQGDWGEMILETILEKSGLKKGEEYFVQNHLTDDAGNKIKTEENKGLQPDVVVVYPGGRKIVIDSKVSLSAYVRYVEAETDEALLLAGREHIVSIKKHIDELSAKSYQDYIDSLDFVMMFIPNEPAYILAMQLDNSLWDYAYRKRILMISPTNLIASLKVVEDLWKREYQSQNAEEIADRGAKLYDKFVGFVSTLDEVGKSLRKTQDTYDKAYNQFTEGSGNLVRQAEMLKELGVKSRKNIGKS